MSDVESKVTRGPRPGHQKGKYLSDSDVLMDLDTGFSGEPRFVKIICLQINGLGRLDGCTKLVIKEDFSVLSEVSI